MRIWRSRSAQFRRLDLARSGFQVGLNRLLLGDGRVRLADRAVDGLPERLVVADDFDQRKEDADVAAPQHGHDQRTHDRSRHRPIISQRQMNGPRKVAHPWSAFWREKSVGRSKVHRRGAHLHGATRRRTLSNRGLKSESWPRSSAARSAPRTTLDSLEVGLFYQIARQGPRRASVLALVQLGWLSSFDPLGLRKAGLALAVLRIVPLGPRLRLVRMVTIC